MPDLVLDYHRLKTPIDHPDASVTGSKFLVDLTSTILVPTIFPGLWGFSGKTTNAVLGKVMPLWGAGLATEDAFWRYYYAVSDEGSFRRLSNVVGDVISVIGSPSISTNLLTYGLAIHPYRSGTCATEGVYLTNYSLTDVDNYWIVYGTKGSVMERSQSTSDLNNTYAFDFDTPASTADFKIGKTVNGSSTTLAAEAVDLSSSTYYSLRGTIVGSTLSYYRNGSLRLQATDTTFASGVMGLERHEIDLNYMRIYRKAYGTIKGVLAPQLIVETEIEGEGTLKPEDPYRPKLKSDLASIESLTGLPSYLYKQTDVQQQVDLDSVSWGAFEFDANSPTNIIMIYGDNPYKSGAVQRQADYLKSRNLRVFTPPKDYNEAVTLYNRLKRDYPHWLAGKDNFAYQVLGWGELEWFQNVDFYYGELVEHKTHYQQLKQVPDWEIRNRLNELISKLSKVTILTDERDNHLAKAREILKKGW